MYNERVALYKRLEEEFDSRILSYITSDRPNMSAQIAPDVIDYFIDHLDKIGPCKKISLFLYTRGGDTSAARNIVNLLRMYCDELQVIVPHKAHSSGTIISLGANEVVMTKQATLGPIDPSLHTALNPRVADGSLFPVSVEAVKGYLEFAKNELSITDDASLASIFEKLTDFVHPLVLGEVYRSKAQIQMMAEKLLQNQVTDPEKIKKIIDFLCSESGSHDYTINRREAQNELGLNIKKPSADQYELIKGLYDDINDELQFSKPFMITEVNGAYAVRRCLLESVVGGSDYFTTEGVVVRAALQDGQIAIQNRVNFEGWRHDRSSDNSRIAIGNGEEEIVYERGNEFQT
ncbi:MAG: ATP-dependent Clp protease proteolytic subunit [Lachnospiraceae bacterium]|nr:ATP-dependent Clp protease proteolytic subunit [Lachnospiraceae bacterium]